MEVRVTDDLGLVKAILTHPANWPYLVNDDVPADFQMPGDWLYLVVLNPEPVGIYALHALDDETVSGHLAMLPEGRGPMVQEATKLVEEFVWNATPAKRIVARAEEGNVRAIKAAQKCGFEVCGRIEGAVRKSGELVDMIELEKKRA